MSQHHAWLPSPRQPAWKQSIVIGNTTSFLSAWSSGAEIKTLFAQGRWALKYSTNDSWVICNDQSIPSCHPVWYTKGRSWLRHSICLLAYGRPVQAATVHVSHLCTSVLQTKCWSLSLTTPQLCWSPGGSSVFLLRGLCQLNIEILTWGTYSVVC